MYTNIKIQFDELKLKCDELEAKLHSNELIVQMSRNSKSSSALSRLTHLEEETKDSHMKLSLADKEIVSLKLLHEELSNISILDNQCKLLPIQSYRYDQTCRLSRNGKNVCKFN